jgi:hypothetical protein
MDKVAVLKSDGSLALTLRLEPLFRFLIGNALLLPCDMVETVQLVRETGTQAVGL